MADLRPERPNLRHERPGLRLEKPDLRPGGQICSLEARFVALEAGFEA